MSKPTFPDTPQAPGVCLSVRGKGTRLAVRRLVLAHIEVKEYTCLMPGAEHVRESYNDAIARVRDRDAASAPLVVGGVAEGLWDDANYF